MANRPEVRDRLRERGIDIPDDTWFIGGYHDTCSDDVELFDLDSLPPTHHAIWSAFVSPGPRPGHAMPRSARGGSNPVPGHGSGRRTAPCGRTQRAPRGARPEYGHCTNAVCIVGRRSLTRGLFLDRRAFLVSYDANQDAG
jgi:uncharacterized protein